MVTRNLQECADYEVGAGPFTLTAFHDGVDGLTIDWIEVGSKPKKREVPIAGHQNLYEDDKDMLLLKVETDARTVKCYIDHKLDDHSFVKSHCN